MSDVKTLRDQAPEELKALYQELSGEIYRLRNERNVTRQVEKPHLLRMKKKDRARVMTILREKEINATG